MVDELLVECPHKPSGCKTTCQRQLLEAHIKDDCQYVPVPCSDDGCKQTVLRRDLGKHASGCMHRLIGCPACGTSVTASEVEEHSRECSEQETHCGACDGTYKRSELAGHTATCSEVKVPCTHAEHGCSWSDKRRYLDDHLPKCPYEAIKGFFAVNDARMSALRNENIVLRQKLNNAEASIQALRRELATARKALGPWWRSEESCPRASSSEASSELLVPSHSGQGNSEQQRWRSPNPLSPLLNFSPETSPISPSDEVDSLSGSPTPSFTDPAFLASYFPSGTTTNPPTGESSNASSPPIIPQSIQGDPLTRHLFPFTNRVQSIYPPPPIRFPDPPSSQGPGATLRVPPINRSTTLEGALLGLRNSISSVSGALDALARRTDVALTTENLRMNEEVGALRAIVHGLRMQVHALITERNGSSWATTTTYYNQPPPAPHPPLVINSTTQTQTTKL